MQRNSAFHTRWFAQGRTFQRLRETATAVALVSATERLPGSPHQHLRVFATRCVFGAAATSGYHRSEYDSPHIGGPITLSLESGPKTGEIWLSAIARRPLPGSARIGGVFIGHSMRKRCTPAGKDGRTGRIYRGTWKIRTMTYRAWECPIMRGFLRSGGRFRRRAGCRWLRRSPRPASVLSRR